VDKGADLEPPLALLLLLASRWFDNQSLTELARRGWPRLSSAQSLLFAYIDEAGTPPAELARRLGHSRQATHQLVEGLVQLGLLEVGDDPGRRGGRLVRPSDRGMALATEAAMILRELETSLGTHRARTLRRLLADFLDKA
jgi:DNA-binding MarR family transcriptional regulator